MENDKILPKGFSYLSNEELRLKRNILTSFINASTNIFTEVVEFPPIAFADTFKKGANITGDKTYEFKDRGNRDLILTPDSQAHLFNYYLSTNNQNKIIKYSWVSPIFRYRNIPKRFYYQMGYASINHSSENEIIDLYLCVRQIIKFIKGITPNKITISIYNSALAYEIIFCILKKKEDADMFFNNIRNIEANKVVDYIEELFIESNHKTILKEIFFNKFNNLAVLSPIMEFNEGLKMIQFIQLLKDTLTVDIKLELSNLYCSEILDGIGISIEIGDVKIGDGGIYNIYGRKYSEKINTAISVCIGSGLYQKIQYVKIDKPIIIFIKDYQNQIKSALLISDELCNMGYKVNLHPWSKANKKYFDESSNVIFLEIMLLEAEQVLFSGKFVNESSNYLQTFVNAPLQTVVSIIISNIPLQKNEL